LRVYASLVSNIGEPLAIFERRYQSFLFEARFACPLMSDQRVGYVGKSGLDRSFISNKRLVALRLGEADVRPETAGGEDGLRELRDEAPRSIGPGKKIRQLRALPPDRTR
jgi:hypothetical protein